MQMVIKTLKARTVSVDGLIRNMADIGSHVYDATLIGKVISKIFKKSQNVRCLFVVH